MGSERTAYIFLLLLCALIIVIPLPFAGMDFFWRHVIEAAILFGCSLTLILNLTGKIKFSARESSAWRRKAETAFVIFLVWCALLMVSIPKGIFENIFPHRAEVKSLNLIGGFFSSSIGFGFWEGERELIVWICALALFFMTTRLAISRSAIWIMISAVAFSATFQAMYGICEFATDHQHIFGFAKKYYDWCATGTFIGRNHYAAYLLISLVVMWASCVYLWRRGEPHDKPKSLVLALWSVFVGAAMVASGARGELVGAIIAIVGFHFMLANGETERKKPYFIALLLVVGIAVMATWVGWEPLSARLSEAGLKESGGRPIAWVAALKMMREFGFFGVGVGSFGELYLRYRPQASGFNFDHAHNDYLELFAETGFVGFAILSIALAFALAFWFDRLRKRRSRFAKSIGLACGMAAIGISLDALVNFPLRNPAVLWQFAIVLGIGAASLDRRKQDFIFIKEDVNRKAKKVVIAVMTLILGFNSIRLASSQSLLDRYRSIQKQTHTTVEEQKIQLRKNILDRAIALAPEDFRLHYEMAKLFHREALLKKEDKSAYPVAIEQYRRALSVSPHNCQARLWGAVALMQCIDALACGTSASDEARWFGSALECCESCGQTNATSLIWAIDRKKAELAKKLVNRAIEDSTALIPQIVEHLWNRLGRTRAEALVFRSIPANATVYSLFAQELFVREQLLSADRFWRESKALEGAATDEATLFGVVRNGSFEDPLDADPFGWKLYHVDGIDVERVSAGCREGAYCLKLEFTGAIKNYYQLEQDVALFAGRYEFSGWFKVENAGVHEVIGIELVRPKAPDKAVVQLFVDNGKKGWQDAHKSFVVSESTERFRLRVRRIVVGETAQRPTVWIDAIHISEVQP